MRIMRFSLTATCCAVVLWGCGHFQGNRDELFQASTIGALLEGAYDGYLTCKELKKHGDLGIGTFDGLDGEMIVLEGKVYQLRADGKVYSAQDSLRTPFAVVTFFEPDKTLLFDACRDYEHLQQYLDDMLPTKNIFYALKIEGAFKYVKTRSVPRQNKPYPRLVDVVKNQPTFEFHNVRGTIVGFRLPSYMEGINVPGYHLHFIAEDRAGGGHLLDCSGEEMKIQVDSAHAFFMVLPEKGDFYTADLTKRQSKEVERVEK